MAHRIRSVDYFQATIADVPGSAYALLGQLAQSGVNLLAFTAVPTGPEHVQLTLFPEDPGALRQAATQIGLELRGPFPAFLAQGDDELGVLSQIHRSLAEVDVNVFASNGVADGGGSFGYVMYVRPEERERAAQALGI